MANDVIMLLDYIGWTLQRQLHIVGLSLGGMISLELASKIAPRLVSLTLIVTSAGGYPWSFRTPLNGVVGLTRVMLTAQPEAKASVLLPLLHPQSWLDGPATEYNHPEQTNYQVLQPKIVERVKITRRQTIWGSLSQMAAALTHRVTPDRLAHISRSIPKVLILTGDEDNLVNPADSFWMKSCMYEAEFIEWTGTGHGVLTQHPKRLNQLLEGVFQEGQETSKQFQ